MATNNRRLTKATTREDVANFWDTHSFADFWEETTPLDKRYSMAYWRSADDVSGRELDSED